MNIDENWPRWIRASIAKHFQTVLTGRVSMYLEGDVPLNGNNLDNYVELRIDGPDLSILSPKLSKLIVVVDALVVNLKSTNNIYIFDQNIGITMTAFTRAIQVLKYGNGPNDDMSEAFCLKQTPDVNNDRVILTRFGQINPDIRIQQTSLECTYEAHVSSPFIF